LTGVIVTADALHTQRAHVDYLSGRGAHYLFTVKANQPTLLRQLRALPWADVPVADQTSNTGHGRNETRTVKMTTVAAGLSFPHARLALQVQRRSRRTGSRRWRTETVHAITDLTCDQTSARRNSPTRCALTGASRTGCTGSATSPSPKTSPRSVPDTVQPSWPPYGTSRSACTDKPARAASPRPPAPSADIPAEH
jgi:hypothetical protein